VSNPKGDLTVSTPTDDRIAYRPAEAARALGISRALIYEFMADGTIAYRQVGSFRLITRATLEAFAAPAGGLPDGA